MRPLGAAVIVFGSINAVAFVVVFLAKGRAGDAFAYGLMAALLLGAIGGIKLGKGMLRPDRRRSPIGSGSPT